MMFQSQYFQGVFLIYFSFLFAVLINDRGKRHVFEWFSLYLFPCYNELFFNYLHLRIHPHYPHLLITRIYSITFSALILPTNHFVTKIRPSFHSWGIITAIFTVKKEKRTRNYSRLQSVWWCSVLNWESARYVGQALLLHYNIKDLVKPKIRAPIKY